jgi:DNA-binding winged helix-turn-helix (wHTH) protein
LSWGGDSSRETWTLTKMDENPFYHVGAIDRPECFHNRRSEVRNAMRLLRLSQNVAVTGPRRVGKTSFLRHISHPAVLQSHGVDPQRNLFVYVDCQHRLMQGEKAQVYQMLVDRLAECGQRAGVDGVTGSGNGSAAEVVFESTLKALTCRGLRTVLLLDEFEEMARNSHLDPGFFSNLRALWGGDSIDVAYVTSSCMSLADLCLERQSLLSSPFFNIFRTVWLGLFTEQDSQHLVDDSLRRAGVRFPADLLKLVLEVGGGYPFFLQTAGYWAFNMLIEGEKVTEQGHSAFLEIISAQFAGHFKSYWQKLDAHEKYVLAALPLVVDDLAYQETIEHLRDQCLIARRGDTYDYFSPLFEVFVRRQEVRGVLQAGPLLIDRHREQVLLRGEPVDLTPTNYALLICLMQRAGQVVTSEELWQAAWSGEPHDFDQQVKSGIKSLRRALGDDSDCIVTRRSVGYMFQLSQEAADR